MTPKTEVNNLASAPRPEYKGRVEVDPSDYEFSHGHAPRGCGRWIFCTVNPRRNNYLNHLINANGTYAEAKREAIAKARIMGVDYLWTCS